MRKTYKIGEVASILGVSTDTIRYYEKMGIVYSKKDPSNGTGILHRRIFTHCWTYCFTVVWTSLWRKYEISCAPISTRM